MRLVEGAFLVEGVLPTVWQKKKGAVRALFSVIEQA